MGIVADEHGVAVRELAQLTEEHVAQRLFAVGRHRSAYDVGNGVPLLFQPVQISDEAVGEQLDHTATLIAGMHAKGNDEQMVLVMPVGCHFVRGDVIVANVVAFAQVVLIETLFAGEEVDIAGQFLGSIVQDEHKLLPVLFVASNGVCSLTPILGIVASLINGVQFSQKCDINVLAIQNTKRHVAFPFVCFMRLHRAAMHGLSG